MKAALAEHVSLVSNAALFAASLQRLHRAFLYLFLPIQLLCIFLRQSLLPTPAYAPGIQYSITALTAVITYCQLGLIDRSLRQSSSKYAVFGLVTGAFGVLGHVFLLALQVRSVLWERLLSGTGVALFGLQMGALGWLAVAFSQRESIYL